MIYNLSYIALVIGAVLFLVFLHIHLQLPPNGKHLLYDDKWNIFGGYCNHSSDNTVTGRQRSREDDKGDDDAIVLITDEEDRVILMNKNLSLLDLLQGPATLTAGLTSDNPELVEYVRKHILVPPSHLPYNLNAPNKVSWDQGQGDLIYGALNQKEGFFVEAGAFNGEFLSNSLRLEKHLGWTGLLVEANTKHFNEMRDKHRKAWLANACLSTKPYPMKVKFNSYWVSGKIIEIPKHYKQLNNEMQTQCIPLLTFMLALNKTTIDYFSLDVEGSELDVLKTIPFDKLNIKFLSVEVKHIPEGMKAVIDFMKSHNYKVHEYFYNDQPTPLDVMFIK